MEKRFDSFVISDDKSKLDHAVILDYLARSYWASKRPRERILQSIENSACYGVYHLDEQVGFARVITDGATMYYLADVFVLEAYQRQGLGKKLVEAIVQEYEGLMGLLGTLDAHELYRQYGFEEVPGRFMRRMAQAAETAVPKDEA
ncbi:GNAT family N-acetyltransferase [Paenibacillus sacheonensis]|uniref:GNAT family N-acetyltransferase n=1 Tax=Paenibacillus sacheonensis TaxID=742054 RepID=A0A7X5C1K6_9BACL|nr:GNAT family N-acetyltransferase [Paenibacillus sacheonensis]MBM7565552.1 GNAT superfamily N-acetyltransferase [Paenibacillus sacheonensis]NBC69529.1 GNAT family N-acetyltransferase [Paenibacillus sacheonensis]